MAGYKKPSAFSRARARGTSYDSLYLNPLNELKHNRTASDGCGDRNARHLCRSSSVVTCSGKENAVPVVGGPPSKAKQVSSTKPLSSLPHRNRLLNLKPSSLQLCIQRTEPDSSFGSMLLLGDQEDNDRSRPENAWDYSDSEAAPASSWSTLPNRSLLCRPLPVDIGRCTCVIVKEAAQELNGASLYSFYTNEGQGRQDRKLAVARHCRHKGLSEFMIAQNAKGIMCRTDESFLGTVTANLIGSRYHIWDQGCPFDSLKKQPKLLLAVVRFTPTVTTLCGSYRSIRAWIPKHQSMQLKTTGQIQHVGGLPKNWEERTNRTDQLFSKAPHYNNISKRYELDFRERGRPAGLKICSSVKNFQLTMEDNGKQTILQLGRIGKSKYVMDYRFPLTGYQAFCICLASIDSKLCCSV